MSCWMSFLSQGKFPRVTMNWLKEERAGAMKIPHWEHNHFLNIMLIMRDSVGHLEEWGADTRNKLIVLIGCQISNHIFLIQVETYMGLGRISIFAVGIY